MTERVELQLCLCLRRVCWHAIHGKLGAAVRVKCGCLLFECRIWFPALCCFLSRFLIGRRGCAFLCRDPTIVFMTAYFFQSGQTPRRKCLIGATSRGFFTLFAGFLKLFAANSGYRTSGMRPVARNSLSLGFDVDVFCRSTSFRRFRCGKGLLASAGVYALRTAFLCRRAFFCRGFRYVRYVGQR